MGLRIARERCPNHPDQDAAANCGLCNKPICRQCINLYGYYCSEACRDQNQQQVAAASAGKSAATMASYNRGMNAFRRIMQLTGLLLVLGLGFVVYRLFFDPAGKPVWRWSPPAGDQILVVGEADGRLQVLSGRTLYSLKLSNGKVVSQQEVDKLGGASTIKIVGDRLIGISGMRVCSADRDGSKPAAFEIEDTPENDPVLSADGTRAYYLSRQRRQRDGGGQAGIRLRLHVIDVSAGKELSSQPLSGNAEQVRILSAEGNDVTILAAYPQAPSASKGKSADDDDEQPASKFWRRRSYDWALELVDAATGKGRRKVSLPEQPSGDPAAGGGWVALIVKDTLYALDLAEKKQHKIPVTSTELSGPEALINGGQLFVLYSAGMVCYDLADGKELWQLNAGADVEDLVFADDQIILMGERTESENFDLTKMPGFNQAPDDLMKDFNIGKGARREKVIPVLASVDRRTGKYLWKEENLRGQLLANDRYVVLIADVAQTSNLGFFKEGAELYVRQFHPKTGKKLYQRTTKGVAVDRPRICGDKIIARQLTADKKTTLVAIDLR